MSEELLSELRGPVLYLRIHRPERRNVMNTAVLQGLRDGILRANADAAVRAVVITGTGDKAFCAGAHLQTEKSRSWTGCCSGCSINRLPRCAAGSTHSSTWRAWRSRNPWRLPRAR
ncbi:Enoyl-CoA hydratase/isomerase [compost metagenome]